LFKCEENFERCMEKASASRAATMVRLFDVCGPTQSRMTAKLTNWYAATLVAVAKARLVETGKGHEGQIPHAARHIHTTFDFTANHTASKTAAC
jgi:hypothetical protein